MKKKRRSPRLRLISGLLCMMMLMGLCMGAAASADSTVTYSTKAPEGENWEWEKISEATDDVTGITTTTYGMDTDEDGEHNITLVCSGNQWDYYFDVADESAQYYVTEFLNNGLDQEYTLTDQDGTELPFLMMNGSVVLYNRGKNYEQPGYGSLKLEKVLMDSQGQEVNESDETFAFDISLSYQKPEEVEKDNIAPLLSGTQSYGPVSFSWTNKDGLYQADARVNLKGGESVVMTDIPEGVKYELKEIETKYSASWTGDQKGTIVKDQESAAVCTNTPKNTSPGPTPPPAKTGSFVVKKTVQDADGIEITDDPKEFGFTVALSDLKAMGGSIAVYGSDQTLISEKPFESNAQNYAWVTFKLKGGQYAVIGGLPVGAKYQIVETGAEGYTGSYKVENYTEAASEAGANVIANANLTTGKETLDSEEAKDDINECVTVHFFNKTSTRTPVDEDLLKIPVKKVWSDGDDSHTGDPVTIRLYRTTSEEDAENNIGDEVSSIMLDGQTDANEKEAWQYTFTDLSPLSDEVDEDGERVPYVYFVTEDNVDGYHAKIVKEENDGTWSFTVTNEKGTMLPKSGGPGTRWYTVSGLVLALGAVVCGLIQRRRFRAEKIQ